MILSGYDIFKLVDTFGLPLDIIVPKWPDGRRKERII